MIPSLWKRSFLIFASLLILTASMLPEAAIPVAAAGDIELYTYLLTQSTAAYQFWTTPPSERVFKDSPVPAATGAEVKVYAARNEFEPFQVVVRPAASGNAAVSLDPLRRGDQRPRSTRSST